MLPFQAPAGPVVALQADNETPGDGMLPAGMEDVSKLPVIAYELLKRGYSDADVKKVLGENMLRVMAEVEEVARKAQASGAKPSFAKIAPAKAQ